MLSGLDVSETYELYESFAPYNEFAALLEKIDVNTLLEDDKKKLNELFGFINYRITRLIAELRHLPKQEYFLRGILSQEEFALLVKPHANDEYIRLAEQIGEFWMDEIIDLKRCIRFLRMTTFITSRTISAFDITKKKVQSRESIIRKDIDQLYYDVVYTQSEEYIMREMKRDTIVEPGTVMINGLNLNYDFKTQRVALVTETSSLKEQFSNQSSSDIFPRLRTLTWSQA